MWYVIDYVYEPIENTILTKLNVDLQLLEAAFEILSSRYSLKTVIYQLYVWCSMHLSK